MAQRDDADGTHSAPSAAAVGLWALAGALIFLLVGASLAVGGLYLALIGGSPYYVIAGLVLVVDAFLLFRGHRAAYPLYAVTLLATTAWALWEVGLDFWRLAPRLDIWVILGVWLLLPWVVRAYPIDRRPRRTAVLGALIVICLVLGISMFRTHDDL